jgi:DICT domain-containing protein
MTPGPSSSLREFVDEVASARRTVTVFAPDRIESLESYFETRNVAVEHEPLPDDGSGGFVVVTAEGEFVGSVGARAVRELVAPADRSLEFGSRRAIRVPLNLLADTTFVSFDRRQMLGASREFEDRAYRQERGTLRAGFQSLSKLKAQQAGYESLLKRTRLDVHVYGEPTGRPSCPARRSTRRTTPRSVRSGSSSSTGATTRDRPAPSSPKRCRTTPVRSGATGPTTPRWSPPSTTTSERRTDE